MGSVCQRSGSKVWVGAFRAWDAAAGKWKWLHKSTGATDKAKAMGIVATWEGVSATAKAGYMTKEKALAAVNDILRLAGVETLQTCPSLLEIGDAILADRQLGEGTVRKYKGCFASLKSWAGAKIKKPADAWGHAECTDFYRHLKTEFSATTANMHFGFLAMLFGRAVELGHRVSNPTGAVERVSNETVNKGTIGRPEAARLLLAMRREGRRDWCVLFALGWHTGHRIQDLLDVTSASAVGDLLSIRPRKKLGKEGAREIVLPLPGWLACAVRRQAHFKSIHAANNRSGKASDDFNGWLIKAGVDPRPIQRKKRTVNQVSFHSLRHSMVSRLTAAGVSGDVARMVTDHDSAQVHRRYQHAEIESLRTALKKAR